MSSVSALAAMFPPAQRPFVMLLEGCDSYKLNAQVSWGLGVCLAGGYVAK